MEAVEAEPMETGVKDTTFRGASMETLALEASAPEDFSLESVRCSVPCS